VEDIALLKEEIRRKIWKIMEERNIAKFPRPVFNRIPNFEGAEEAARRLQELQTFQNARVIKVNPDSPQKPIRESVLSNRKMLVTPTPRLKSGFLLLDLKSIPRSAFNYASTIKGAFKYGRQIDLAELPKVDLIIVGSVAVSLDGARIGKGGGYSEIECGILRELNLIDDKTPIATTVHEVQVLEKIPTEEHDIPVDIIITPERIIETKTRYPRPKGIFWKKITEKMLQDIPVLKKLEEMRHAT
jgi:5-formyltetrahydrofolate cyclo-ligase